MWKSMVHKNSNFKGSISLVISHCRFFLADHNFSTILGMQLRFCVEIDIHVEKIDIHVEKCDAYKQ